MQEHQQDMPSPQERRIVRAFALLLVGTVVAVPILSVITFSPIINVAIGLLPLIVTLVLDIIATARHYKTVMYWIIVILVHILSLGVVYLLNLLLDPQLDVVGAVGLSFLLAVVGTVIVSFLGERPHIHRAQHTVTFTPEKLPEYVQSIEDKAKGINFAIGRVYRASNGGTSAMRERLRIPREWYNEFYAIQDSGEQRKNAKVLVHRIHDRLRLLAKREREVFSSAELAHLKNLARAKDGGDAIIDVLKTNDRDPVQHYYVSAVDLCERILEELKDA